VNEETFFAQLGWWFHLESEYHDQRHWEKTLVVKLAYIVWLSRVLYGAKAYVELSPIWSLYSGWHDIEPCSMLNRVLYEAKSYIVAGKIWSLVLYGAKSFIVAGTDAAKLDMEWSSIWSLVLCVTESYIEPGPIWWLAWYGAMYYIPSSIWITSSAVATNACSVTWSLKLSNVEPR